MTRRNERAKSPQRLDIRNEAANLAVVSALKDILVSPLNDLFLLDRYAGVVFNIIITHLRFCTTNPPW